MTSYKPDVKQFEVGNYVVMKNREGYIRFIGKREHYHGTWYGIELTVGQGPNDGSEHGKRYFTCKQRHGIFVRLYAIKKKLDQSEIDPRRLNKSPLSGALPSLPQSTTLSERGSSSRASPRSNSTDTSTPGPTPSPSHFHNINPHQHQYGLKLSNQLMATGTASRPGSTRASKASSKISSLWQKPSNRPKSTRASLASTKCLKLKSITSFNTKSKTSSRDGGSSRACSPKTPTLTPSLISSPRTIATSPSPSVSPTQSPTGYSRIHPNHVYLSNTRSNSPRTPLTPMTRSSIKDTISARVKGGHYKHHSIEIIDCETSDGEDSDSDEQNLATPKGRKTPRRLQNGKVRFFGDDRNVVLPMSRASTISVTDKIASTIKRRGEKKSKRNGDKKQGKRQRSRSRDTKRNKNKNKKRSKSKRGGSAKSKDHDRGRTDIDIFKRKKDKKDKKDKRNKKNKGSQYQEMNDEEKLREINRIKKYDKRESFHKRKSRTLDFTLNAHREDLKQIMQFRADSESSDDDDDDDDDDDNDVDDDLNQRDNSHSHSQQSQLILPPIPPQSPGKYTFRLHIKNPNNTDGHNPSKDKNRHNRKSSGDHGHFDKKSYELQLSNHDKPVPLTLKQSYSLSDDHQPHIGPHLSLAVNDSIDDEEDDDDDVAIVGYNTGRPRADTNNSESSNIAHTYEVTEEMKQNRYAQLPHDAQMQIENNKLCLLKKDLWGLNLVPDTPMDSDNDQFDSAYDRISYGAHSRQASNKRRGIFLENNGYNKKSQAFHPLQYSPRSPRDQNVGYPEKSTSQIMSELGRSQKIVITPENTMNNGSSNDEMDAIDDECLNDDILFISQNNMNKTKLRIPRNDTNGNNLNTKTNGMAFEIDESVIEYHVPSINKKKKNQNIKINIHINNDIVNNNKKPNDNKNNNGNNNVNKNKLCGHSLNPKFTFNPNHIPCHKEQEEQNKKHQHRRMKSSSKQKRNGKIKDGKHRYSRSTMGQELIMTIPSNHHKKKKKQKKKKSSSIKKHKHKHRSNTLEARHEIPPRPSSTRPSKTNKMKSKSPTHRRHASKTTSSHRHTSKSKKNCACHKHHDSQYSHHHKKSSSKTKKDKKSNKHQIRFRSKSGKPRNPIPPISPRNIGFKRHQSMQQTYDWTGLI